MELDEPESRPTWWIALAVVVVVLALVGGFVGWTLNSAAVKARLVDAVQRATGRTLTLAGDTRVRFSLTPTVSMEDVALANPPGFSRPEMVKVARLEVGLALLPLLAHRLEIDHVTLVRPDILLEIDPTGRPNWVFSRAAPQPRNAPAAASAGPGTPPPPETTSGESTPKQRLAVLFRNASVEDGRIGWLDRRSGHQDEAEVPQLTLAAPGGKPAQLTGTIDYRGQAIQLTGRAEPTGVSGAAPGSGPWPVSLKLESAGSSVTADGHIDQPLTGRGYTLAIDADLPDPSIFAPLFPRLPLASLKSVTAHAEVSDSGGPTPTISVLQVKVGSVDIGKLGGGATLEDVTLGARDNAPLRLTARVTRDGFDSGITGNVGDLAWLAGGASGPVSVDLEWNAASARASVTGTIQEPARPAGYALDVAVNVPKPSLVMDDAPPALRAVTFQTRLTDAPGPVPFRFNSNAGDLAGELSVSRLPKSSSDARVAVQGQVSSQRLDLDMLLARPPAAAPDSAPSSPIAPAEPNGKAAPGDNPAAVPDRPVAGSEPALIPDTKLPFDLIRKIDGSVNLAFADVRLDGVDFRKIDGVVGAKDGQFRIDPFTIAAPDQQLSGKLVADAAKTPPVVHLAINAPALAAQVLLGVVGLPQIASGNADVQADLTGTGDSPRAIAASLDGWAGVAIEGGQLDTKMINAWLGSVEPLRFSGPDNTDLRCFAMRADIKSGVATIQPVALSSPALIVDGKGEVDLGQETMALTLRPRTRIGGTGIALPVRLSGPIRNPSAGIDISGKAFGGAFGGLMIGGKDVMGAAGGGDPCPAALARARETTGAPASGAKP